ncbi:MAG: hypothetical protein J6C13_03845, partial [Clostridia bacterium]|nr:hypothetical protein [Clostridia bacterium]
NLVWDFEDVSKIFIMYLHNLHTYCSEGTSGRHTPLTLNSKEKEVFDYFYKAFYDRENEKHPDKKEYLKKQVAFESARFIAGVDAKTNLVHSISLRQLNYIYKWAQDFLNKEEYNIYERLAIPDMKEFCEFMSNFTIDGEHIIRPELAKDPYNRSFQLFGDGQMHPERYGKTYEIYYQVTAPTFDQLQRHRSIYYQASVTKEPKYYIPTIVKELEMQEEWCDKIDGLENVPQGRLLNVFEYGTLDAFVMKLKERCCEYAQEEARDVTKQSANRIFEGLKYYDYKLAEEMINRYGNNKNRCDFPDYKCICANPCNKQNSNEQIKSPTPCKKSDAIQYELEKQ